MVADPKPQRRIVDPVLMRELTDAGQNIRCLVCDTLPSEPHHVRLKSQGGDDVEANIVFLCKRCHGAYHGTPYYGNQPGGFARSGQRVDAGWVRFKLARYLETDQGTATRAYLVEKMGRGPADAYLKREFGIQS